jgi:hypothetical protein
VNKRLPADAFAHYLSLGVDRRYEQVAAHFGVSKRTVTATAKREHWQKRVAEADGKAREKAAESYVDTLQDMNSKHLKVLQFMLGRGIEGLKNMPVTNFGEAVRAVSKAIEQERLIRGQPTERTENLESIVRREHERWTKRGDGADEWNYNEETRETPEADDQSASDGAAA